MRKYKFYKRNTLIHFNKTELIELIECLQHNLQNEESLNNHLYSTITAVMKKDRAFSRAVCEVLDIWNKYSGHRYEEIELVGEDNG